MANQESTNFDDQWPEDENPEKPDALQPEPELENHEADDFSKEALESDEELDELEGDESFRQRPVNSSKRTLAGLAGRTALKWASQPTPSAGRNGYHPRPHKSVHRLAEPLDEDNLERMEPGLFDQPATIRQASVCSAALLEEYELMAALATAASKAGSRTEAEGLVAAIVPLSIRLNPQFYRALWRTLPTLLQGTVGVTRLLYGRAATRPLIRLMPFILESTATRLAGYVARGRPLNRSLVARTLARQTRMAIEQQRQQATTRATRLRHEPQALDETEWWNNGYGGR